MDYKKTFIKRPGFSGHSLYLLFFLILLNPAYSQGQGSDSALKKLSELETKLSKQQELLEKTERDLHKTKLELEEGKKEKDKTLANLNAFKQELNKASLSRKYFAWNLEHKVEPYMPVYKSFLENIESEIELYQNLENDLIIKSAMLGSRPLFLYHPEKTSTYDCKSKCRISPAVWDIILEKTTSHTNNLITHYHGYLERLKELEEFVNFEIVLDEIESRRESKYSDLKNKYSQRYNTIKKKEDSLKTRQKELIRQKEEGETYLSDLLSAYENLKKGLEDKLFFEQKGKLPWPVEGIIVRNYGIYKDKELGIEMMNRGIDITVPNDGIVKTVFSGVVIYAEQLVGYGLTVIISHGNNYFSLYSKCSELVVNQGKEVAKGEKIAYIYSNNKDKEPVLHFEIRKKEKALEPVEWLQKK